MAESQIKKSTIMFTDVFGYSRMVGRDEKHALKLLDEHNKIITAVIDAHDATPVVSRLDILTTKLADDSITFKELKELMRLRG